MFTILSHWPWEKSVMLTKDWGFQETNENQETKKKHETERYTSMLFTL